MIMLFSMTAMPWSCLYFMMTMTWSYMIIPWRVWITMIIPCHSMIVIFDHGCQPENISKLDFVILKLTYVLSTINLTWDPRNSVINILLDRIYRFDNTAMRIELYATPQTTIQKKNLWQRRGPIGIMLWQTNTLMFFFQTFSKKF